MAKKKIVISYNSPVILTFCIFCAAIFAVNAIFGKSFNITSAIFTVPGNNSLTGAFDFKSPLDYVRLFTHVLGHQDLSHLIGNLSIILLIGPLLEERYGSAMILLMICITALVTGVLNACLMPFPLLGASGVGFMLIILSSFTSISKSEIPLSFIFVFVLFLGSEIFVTKQDSQISVLAHVAGGLCGSMFGFLIAPKSSKKSTSASSSDSASTSQKSSFWAKHDKSKNNKQNANDSEETIIGTIEL